jgi:hypothetical protein
MKRKTKLRSKARTIRKNQNSRIRAKKANKQNIKSFVKKAAEGELIVHDKVQPFSKHIWPNQAIAG